LDDELPPLPDSSDDDLFSSNDLPDNNISTNTDDSDDIFGGMSSDENNLNNNLLNEDNNPFSSSLDDEKKEDQDNSVPDFNWDDEAVTTPKTKHNTTTKKQSAIFDDIDEEELKVQIDEHEAEQVLQEAISRDEIEKKEKKRISLTFIIILTLLIIVSGLIGTYYFFPEQLPIKKIIENLQREQKEEKRNQIYKGKDPSQKITVKGIKRIINDNKQNIAIFYGTVKNVSHDIRSYFKIKIILFDKDETPIFEKEVYAGNTFKDEQLKILPPNEIERRLRNKFGDTFINESVPPGKEIPFEIVLVNPTPFVDYKIISESSLISN